MKLKTLALAALTTIAVSPLAVTSAIAADKPAVIKAVGTWGNLTNYSKHEGPFWNSVINEASEGQIIGEIKPMTELGLKGFENFEEIYNAKLLMLYPFPSQTLWCNAEVNGLSDLKGKKIRVYSTSLGDFVEGAGGVSVTVAFGEVIPALEKGVVDCAITGTMSAYKANWQQVATHAYTLRVGWGLAFGAMNLDKWNSMSADQQATLSKEIDSLNERMWSETATEDDVAIACITGGECDIGEKGSMKLVEPSADDLKMRDQIASDVILARWAERCGQECADNWNNTVGPILNLKAEAK